MWYLSVLLIDRCSWKFVSFKQFKRRYLCWPNLKFWLPKLVVRWFFTSKLFFLYDTVYNTRSYRWFFHFKVFFCFFFFFNNTRHNTRRSVNVSFEAKSQQNCYCVWQVFNGLAVSQHTTGIYKVRTTTSSLGFPLSDEKSYATSLSTGTPSPLRLDTYAARKKINRDE